MRKSECKGGLRLACLAGAFASISCFGLVVARKNVQHALDTATLIARIEILSRESAPHPTYSQITHARARIESIEKFNDDGGPLPSAGDEITVESAGGERDGTGVFFSGLPRPYVRSHYRAYLNRIEGRVFGIAGFEHGLQPLSTARTGTRNRTDGSNGQGTGAFLFWDTRYWPLPYFVSLSTFKNQIALVDAIDSSFQTWRSPADSRVDFIAMGCTSVTQDANDGLNKIILVSDKWQYQGGDIIALTRNFYVADDSNRSGQILVSDILLNAVDYQFSTTGEIDKFDVQDIVTHEVGHFIGLGHEKDPIDVDSTMYALAIRAKQKRES